MKSETFAIPELFRDGRPIEQIVLICDVDGVVREGTDSMADPRVIASVKSLLRTDAADVAFISGTPVATDLTLEPWRRANVSLSALFGTSFEKELLQKIVTIYGVLGGDRMREDGSIEILDAYSPELSWDLCKLLVEGFLKEVLDYGLPSQKNLAIALQKQLERLSPKEGISSHVTAKEFHEVVDPIRSYLDPGFRLLSNGALIETHTSNPPWGTALSVQWLKEELNLPHHGISHLSQEEKQIASGLGKKEGQIFNYLLIGKKNKGMTMRKHISEKLARFPGALVVTLGDTQVDFPMHHHAHIAFHVGSEEVWRDHPLDNCVLVLDSFGKDSQHVEGTLQVLQLLQNSFGKSFYNAFY
jgi:hypothetical protein